MTAFSVTLSKVPRIASFAVLLAALGGGLPQAAEAPEMIYVNAKIITLDSIDRVAEAVAIEGGEDPGGRQER